MAERPWPRGRRPPREEARRPLAAGSSGPGPVAARAAGPSPALRTPQRESRGRRRNLTAGATTLAHATDRATPLHQQSALQIQLQVLHALILRDIRTRFGRTMWGYVIIVGWPVAHLFVLVVTFLVRKVPAPIGESTALFIHTGMTPMIIFIYLSRKMMEGVLMNKPLLSFPDVKFLDVCLSRGLVEILNACMSVSLIMFILAVSGVNPIPDNAFLAIMSILTSIFFAFGLGIVSCNVVHIFPPFQLGFALFIILFYALSGVFFLPDGMPSEIYHVMLWNPMTNLIMVFRSAYYPQYTPDASLTYVALVSALLTFVGLLWERFFTRYI
ncbi:ABC transporter permease [Methylobacterium sp. WSM2598]|uniref:ABC transporter permease n=1 Tax=Methylobacterium sp. WSM2598 TaxID=398261 RepID=UPI001F0044A1|nr:ABC transporter permease [Methylobacterium sp. WSM2598]